ncbi:hypothetical protein EI534_26640 [Pseudomonas frederiksbergensis]|nr:hypothetical protein [Pseudomonas frederiksbergensis]
MWFLAFSLCSSCRACEAAFGCEAVANANNRFLLTHCNLWFYDGFAASRCSTAATGPPNKIVPTRHPLQALAQLPTPSPD